MPGTAPESWTTAYQEAMQDAYQLTDRKTLDPGASARIRALVAYAAEVRTGLAAGLLPPNDTVMTPFLRGMREALAGQGPTGHGDADLAATARHAPAVAVPMLAVPMRDDRPRPLVDPCFRCGSYDHHSDNHDEDLAATTTLTTPPVVPGQGGEPRIMCHCGATGAAHPHGLYDSCTVDVPTPRDVCWCGGPETPAHTRGTGPVCGPQ